MAGLRAALCLAAWILAGVGPANASWLDSDFYCRAYGCVIVHDGRTFDVYDNYDFATGRRVPPGGRMIAWSGNPFQGSGAVNPVITGTRTEGFHLAPLREEGVLLGIDQTGDGEIDLSPGGNARGFLDASAGLSAFGLDGRSDIAAGESSSRRSFYLSSRTDFYLAASARLRAGSGELSDPRRLSQVRLRYDIREAGNDDGMAFGSRAANGNFYRFVGNVDDVGDLAGGAVNIVEFRRAIRRRSSPDLPSQSVRFDYVYGFDSYDLSLGAGDLRYAIEFEFYNR